LYSIDVESEKTESMPFIFLSAIVIKKIREVCTYMYIYISVVDDTRINGSWYHFLIASVGTLKTLNLDVISINSFSA
jgi:hypothetical protein